MAMLAPLFLVVNAQAPFKTLQEMIAYGKSKPDGLTFGSPGAGSQPHLAAELLFRDAGVKGLIVPFRGDNMAYTELLASRLDATLTAISPASRNTTSAGTPTHSSTANVETARASRAVFLWLRDAHRP